MRKILLLALLVLPGCAQMNNPNSFWYVDKNSFDTYQPHNASHTPKPCITGPMQTICY